MEPENHMPLSGMDAGVVLVPGVPGLPPGAFCVRNACGPKSPRRKPGDSGRENPPACQAVWGR